MSKRAGRGTAVLILALITPIGACGSTSSAKSDAASDAGGGAGGDGDGAGGRETSSDGDDNGSDGDGAGGRDPGGDVGADGDDGGGDGAVEVASRGCDPSRPFGTSILVDSLNSQGVHDGGARLSADELTVYFFSNRRGGYDVFTATRTDRSSAFGMAQLVAGLNTASYDDFPSPTADGLTMYIETNRTGTYQIFVATRTTLAADFVEAVPVANINAGPVEAFPFVRPDNSGLYFSSNRSTAIGGYDLYLAERGTNGQFGAPMPVSTVNGALNEWAPVPSFDEQTIYFASDRTDPAAKGAYDIWMARRSSKTASFDPPVILQEVNTDDEDVPSWISPDNCRLYLTHMVNKWRKIYVAERAQ